MRILRNISLPRGRIPVWVTGACHVINPGQMFIIWRNLFLQRGRWSSQKMRILCNASSDSSLVLRRIMQGFDHAITVRVLWNRRCVRPDWNPTSCYAGYIMQNTYLSQEKRCVTQENAGVLPPDYCPGVRQSGIRPPGTPDIEITMYFLRQHDTPNYASTATPNYDNRNLAKSILRQ